MITKPMFAANLKPGHEVLGKGPVTATATATFGRERVVTFRGMHSEILTATAIVTVIVAR